MHTAIAIMASIAMFTLSPVLDASAQTQRMGVPSTNVQIPATGSATLDAYCLDPTLDAPGPGTLLANVAAPRASVVIDGSVIPLETAVEQGHIQISADKNDSRLQVVIENLTGKAIGVVSQVPWVAADHPFDVKDVDPAPIQAVPKHQYHTQKRRIWDSLLLKRAESASDLTAHVLDDEKTLGASRSGNETLVLQAGGLWSEVAVTRRNTTTGQAETLIGDDAVDAYAAFYSRDLETKVGKLSTATVLHIGPYNRQKDSARVTLGSKSLEINRAQLIELLQGRPVPALTALLDGEPMKPIIVARDGFSQAKTRLVVSENRESIPANYVFAGLRQAYPKRAFYVDDDVLLGERNIASITSVSNGRDVVVVTDDTINDYGIFEDITESFSDAGSTMVKDVDMLTPAMVQQIKAANVIILSGHKSEEFIRFLDKLAATGLLKGKSVALITCGEHLQPLRASRLIENHGAREIIYFVDKINAVAARDLLVEAAQALEKGHKGSLFDLLDASFHRVKSTVSTKVQESLETLHRYMIRQVSEISIHKAVRHG